jgi:hypothetical protein
MTGLRLCGISAGRGGHVEAEADQCGAKHSFRAAADSGAGQRVLFLRHMLAADGGEATTPAHAALILDLKRRYLEMRPRLRRIYSLAADPAAALSQFAPLGFARLPDGAAEIGPEL